MSSTTKIYEEKMNNCVAHLDRELILPSVQAAQTPGILDKVMVDYYGQPDAGPAGCIRGCFRSPHPDHHPWDGT